MQNIEMACREFMLSAELADTAHDILTLNEW